MSYTERTLTSEFAKFMRKNPKSSVIQFSFVCELKLKKGKQRLNFKQDFQPHQIPNLLKTANSCLYHKISDMGIGMKPFDCFNVCNLASFVGVSWYTPRKKRYLYLILVKDIKDNMDRKIKSISEDDAERIALFKLDIKTK